jgi:signal transduction histidine kinase
MTVRMAIRFIALAALIALIAAREANRPAALVLLGIAAVALAAWAKTSRPLRATEAASSLVVVGVTGGVLSVWESASIGLLATAAIAAGTTFPLRRSVPLALTGPLALVVACAAAGWSGGLVIGGTAATLGALLGGISRRQAQEHAEHEARVHLARELHDVLAHTLGALAVQLEAADAVNERGDQAQLSELLRRSRSLVSSGLDEAAEAVRALRDEPVPVVERIAALVEDAGASLRVEGTPRALPPNAGLALYRAAQEAITNARKHAPGEQADLRLSFRDGETVLTVTNAAPSSPVAAPGAGLGLQGMRERLERAGGHLDAGGSSRGFRVEAAVPA